MYLLFFRGIRDGREYEIIKCHLAKGYLVCLGAFLKKWSSVHDANHNSKGDFLKEASKIIDRIRWDSSLDQNDFIVGYEDRFVGVLELSVEDFSSSQVPSHRVKYFKNIKTNEIIWDRTNKITKL